MKNKYDKSEEGSSLQLQVRIYTPEAALQSPMKLLAGTARDAYAGRELAWRLFIRDVSAQYRQTYFGYVWAFLPPLVTTATFIFLQSQGIVRIGDLGMPYPAFAMIGTLLWQTFVEAVQSPISAVQTAKPMLSKINFPREAILMSGVYVVLFNFSVRMVLLIGVLGYFRLLPGTSVVWFPIAMLGLLLCGFAVGMALLPIGTLYGDVGKGIPVLAQFWMLLTPVVYPARTEGSAGYLATLNPISPLIVTARDSLTGKSVERVWVLLVVVTVSLLLCTVGVVAYRLVMPRIIERIGN